MVMGREDGPADPSGRGCDFRPLTKKTAKALLDHLRMLDLELESLRRTNDEATY
jgi:hypothetical protein